MQLWLTEVIMLNVWTLYCLGY